MATIALPLPPSACPPSPSAGAERTIAAAIANHRTARRQILARAAIAADTSVARQLEDALAGLRRLESEFARFRQKSEARIQVARAENTRLANALAEARQSIPSTPPTNVNVETLVPSAKQNQSNNSSSNIPARRRDQYVDSAKKECKEEEEDIFKKPFEDELSVSRLESSVNNTKAGNRHTRGIRASGTPISFEPRWKHRMPMSRSRSAHTVGRAKPSISPSQEDSADSGTGVQRRRRSTAGLFKRSSFSFSRSNRPSSDRASRPGSGRWNSCF